MVKALFFLKETRTNLKIVQLLNIKAATGAVGTGAASS
jgi:hypothetical protein